MITMTYHVHSVEQDLAAKWYARVVITEDEAQFFKFDHFPSMEEIQAAATAFVEAREQAAAAEAEEALTDGTAE
jgi:hypothetical protein